MDTTQAKQIFCNISASGLVEMLAVLVLLNIFMHYWCKKNVCGYHPLFYSYSFSETMRYVKEYFLKGPGAVHLLISVLIAIGAGNLLGGWIQTEFMSGFCN